jgi:centrosomal protein CEP41
MASSFDKYGSKPLQRKTPANPKFANTRTKLDTGFNMRKLAESFEGTSGPNAHKHAKDEFFTRLRPVTLGKLLQPLVDTEESIYQLDRDDTCSVVSSVVPGTANEGEAAGNMLLLDCRPFDAYTQCHVYGAMHYEVSALNKATNNFPREMYFFKGSVSCDKMVVIYDEDGRSGTALGNTFVEKGIENTYVVQGGFLGCCAACPTALSGEPPSPEALAAAMARAGLKPPGVRGLASLGRGDGEAGRCSTAGSVRSHRTALTSLAGSPVKNHWK